MRKSVVVGWLVGVALSIVSAFSMAYLKVDASVIGYAMVAATAASIVGVVLYDYKAFLRSAAMLSKLVTDRLGHRTCSTGSLCRPHGL